MNDFKYCINVQKARFSGLNFSVRVLLIFSLLIIFATELFLNKCYSFWQIQNDLGVIILKLSYSYFSAFIFYYMVVYLPKERRRINSFKYMNNKLLQIRSEGEELLLVICNEDSTNFNEIIRINKQEINRKCLEINPMETISNNLLVPENCSSYYEFICYKANRIKILTNELLILNDLIDESIFRSLTNINETVSSFLTFDNKINRNSNLGCLSHAIFELIFETKQMESHWVNFYSKRYDFQFHKFESKRNKIRNK